MFVAIVYRVPEDPPRQRPRIVRVYGITAETMREATEIAKRIICDEDDEWVGVMHHHEGIQLELLESVG